MSQHCYGRPNVSRKSVTTSGLSILLQGVISLSDATSYDKSIFFHGTFCFQWIWQDNMQFLQDKNIIEHTYFE